MPEVLYDLYGKMIFNLTLSHFSTQIFTLKPFNKLVDTLVTLVHVLRVEEFAFAYGIYSYKLQLKKFWALVEIKTCICLRQNKDKSTWWISSWLDLPYIRRKLRVTLALCWPYVARSCLCFLCKCWKWNKLKTCQAGKLGKNHQNISNLLFKTKVSYLLHEQQLSIIHRFVCLWPFIYVLIFLKDQYQN